MGSNNITDTKVGQWDTAYGWGNHASAGYSTTTYSNSDVDSHLNQSNPTSGYVLSWNGSDYAWVAQSTGFSGNYNDLTNKPTIPTNNNQLTNGAGYITNGSNYNVNDQWLRENGDNANVKLYGNSRQMVFRTDGTSEYSTGVGGYPFVWMYGSNATGARKMYLTTSGNLAITGTMTTGGNINVPSDTGPTTSGTWVRNTTAHGYIQLGPANSGHAHIYTDRSNFYFNKTLLYASGNLMWHAANDGSGSGLDADTVDGIQAASFLRSDADDTVNAGVTYTWSATNTQGLVFQNSSYTGNYLYIGGWSSSNSSGISRIRNSNANLHIDCGSNGHLYFNHYSGGTTYIRGNTAWHAGNDGSGSGLDADTLDGVQGANYMRNNSGTTVAEGTTHRYECYGNIATSAGTQASLECFNSGSQTDAFMTFHVGGDYAAYFGVDGGINDLAYGGWSAGAVSHRVYHAGNTPSQTITVAGIGRNSHHTGHLVGSYNSVGANSYKSNPIYTIGSSYNPSDAALGNMYGIGYSHTNASFITGFGGGWGMYVAADGDARIYFGASSGHIYGTGNVTAYASDRRLKTNVAPIENAIDKVKKIRGVTFDWVDNITSEYDFHPASMHEHGVIAQEIQEVIPDAVVTAPFNGNYARKSGVDHNFLTVDKDKIVPLLIEAIKEQQQQIEELKEKIG
jgi:hypothetical protein